MTEKLEKVSQELNNVRATFESTPKIRLAVQSWTEHCLSLMLPHFSDGPEPSLPLARDQLALILGKDRESLADEITLKLSSIQRHLIEDANFLYQGDPAAQSVDEVILAYPGFLAVAIYRLAHTVHNHQVALVPRLMTEYGHRLTGIDIHPGAKIGSGFVIDHGTGVVIGETSIIKDNVKLYQGVTLGALSVEKSLSGAKRHPTIESNVIIYANATILGGETVIGAGSIVGGNVWLTESIPAGSRVYHVEEHKLKTT